MCIAQDKKLCKAVLIEHYANCTAHWIQNGKSLDEAKVIALNELKQVKSNPFSPKYDPIPGETVTEVCQELTQALNRNKTTAP